MPQTGFPGTAETARRELAGLGDALTLAERGAARHSPADLMSRLLRAARLHPAAVSDGLLLQICDVVSGGAAGDAEKVTLMRMCWAAIVQAQFRAEGLSAVDGSGTLRARAA